MASKTIREESPYSKEEAHAVIASFFSGVTREDICGYVVLGVPARAGIPSFMAADTGSLPQLAEFLSGVLHNLISNMTDQPEEWKP